MSKKKNKPVERKEKVTRKEPSSVTFLKNKKIISVLIAVFCFVLYFNTLQYDFCGDDTILIKENKLVNQGLVHADLLLTKSTFFGHNNQNYGAYRPLAMLTFAAETQVFGLNPFTGHLINILLYILCGMLLYQLLLLFFPGKELVALLVTLLFLSHPVHSEVVANIKSRDELLAFLLSFLIPSILFLKNGLADKRSTAIALLCFFLGLFAKETAVTFIIPVTLSLWFFRNIRIKEILFFCFLPMTALAGIYILIRAAFLDAPPETEISITNTLFHTNTFSEKAGTLLFIQLKNLEKLFFPLTLSWDYSFKQIPVTDLFSAPALFALILFALLITYAAIKTVSKNSIAFFLWLYGSSMVLFSHLLVSLAPNMADRFLFVPALAFCAVIVLSFSLLIDRLKFSGNRNQLLIIPFVLIAILFSARTVARNSIWKNNETMFRSGIKDSPNSYYAFQTLGQYLSANADSSINPTEKKELYTEAEKVLETANELCPEVQDNWYLLGRCAYFAGDFSKAEFAYKQSIERFDKIKKESVFNLAVLYKEQKEYNKAIEWLKKANDTEENFMNSYSIMGEIYLLKNEPGNAQVYLNKALEKNPQNENVLNNLGVSYFTQKDYAKAEEYFSKSVSYFPCSFNGLKNLAATLQNENKLDEAISLYQKLIQCYPNDPTGYELIIAMYSMKGNSAKAAEYQSKLNAVKGVIR